MRNRKSCGKSVFAAILIFLGLLCLCCVSYRFLLILIAGIFIVIGLILIRKC